MAFVVFLCFLIVSMVCNSKGDPCNIGQNIIVVDVIYFDVDPGSVRTRVMARSGDGCVGSTA